MDKKRICLIGSSSDLGVEVAKVCKSQNMFEVFGISRQESRNKSLYEENLIITDYESDKEMIANFVARHNITDIVFFNGFIGHNNKPVEKIVEINLSIPLSLINSIGKNADENITYTIISSLATSRPRAKNYIYGLSKYILEESIRNRDVGKYIIFRSGFIRTKMTADHKEPPFAKNPEEVADKLIKAIRDNEKKVSIVYSSLAILLLFHIFKVIPLSILNAIEKKLV